MKKLLLGLILSLLSTSAIMAQSFQSNNEETVRIAYALYESRYVNYNSFLTKLCIPLYMSYPKDGTVRYCWYDTKMVFGEKVRTGEKPNRIEEGTYVNGRLSMYKKSDNEIYKFNWVNDGTMILLESIVLYNGAGSEMRRSSGQIYRNQWHTERTISARASNHHTRSVTMTNALITEEYRNSEGGLYLEGYDFYGGLRKKTVGGHYYKRDWKVSNDKKVVLKIMPDGRFSEYGLSDKDLYDFNDHVRCECYAY